MSLPPGSGPDADEPLLITDAEFAAVMAALGPFEPAPRIAAGVSGGPDSMALALLADRWARQRDGSLLSLVVDHGLRRESAGEAALTVARLAERGITAKLLTIEGLPRGPGLAERARAARYRTLLTACTEAGILHLLLGHHAGDQAETLMMRVLSGSGSAGLAGMAPLVETAQVRLLRPLLGMQFGRLRETLRIAGVAWVEDPSNRDRAALRPRLRMLRRSGEGTAALVEAAALMARRRAEGDRAVAVSLAEHVVFRPEGFAVVRGSGMPPRALAALLQTISGAPYPPATASVANLGACLGPATLAGVRLMDAGRLGPGLLAIREAAAMSPAIPAHGGANWDGRFRLGADVELPHGATMGALGEDAARLRRFSDLPSAVLRTLPAIRLGMTLLAVPHLLYPDQNKSIPVLYCPSRPAAAAPFGFGDA